MKKLLLLFTAGLFAYATSYAQFFMENSIAAGIDHYCADSNQMAGGVAVFDMNNDGWDDIYMVGGEKQDHLYLNNQDGTFDEISTEAGLGSTAGIYTTGVVSGDINNDGLRDLFVSTGRYENNLLFLNNGNNTFTDISLSAGITHETWSMQAVMADYNNDGYLDIYVVNYVEYSVHPFFMNDTAAVRNYFYINNGNSTFTENAAGLGVDDPGSGLVAMFSDYDQDGDQDLIVGNDFHATFGQPSQLYLNNYPMNSFYAVGPPTDLNVTGSIMGIAGGDPDGDLDFDYHLTNMGHNWYFENENDGTFRKDSTTYASYEDSLTGWGNVYFDYDNDMDEDFYYTNGQVLNLQDLDQANVFMINDGTGNFTSYTTGSGAENVREHRGMAISDFDHDGDMDLISVFTPHLSYAGSEKSELYLNTYSGSNNWIGIRLKGTTSNRDGIGAIVRVVAGGKSQIRELRGGSGYMSQQSAALHVGISTSTSVDSVIITWPSGNEDIHLNPNINEVTYYIEGFGNCSGTNVTNYNNSICEGDSTLLADAYRTTAGIYQLVQPTTNTCDNLLMFNLTVNPLPTTVITGDSIVCAGDSVKLTAGGAATYLWNGVDTGSVFSHLPAGSVSYVVQGSENGCTYNDTLDVTVVALPALTVTSDTTICNGDSIELLVSGAQDYTWQAGASLDSAYLVMPASKEDFVVEGTSAEGCVSTDTVTVMVEAIPVLVTSSDSTICEGDSIELTVNGASTYEWNAGVSQDSSYTVAPVDNEVFYVTGFSVHKCEAHDSVYITLDTTSVQVGFDIVIDWNTNPAHQLIDSSENVNYWVWTVDGTFLDSAQNSEYEVLDLQNHTICLKAGNGCKEDSVCEDILAGGGIWENTFQANDYIQLYPNPADQILMLQWKNVPKGSGNFTLRMYNVLGEQVSEKTVYAGQAVTMDISEYSAGMYSVRLYRNESGEGILDQQNVIVK